MTALETIEREFAKTVKDHMLEVVADSDSGFRHLRCRGQFPDFTSWEVVTWCGHMAVTGCFGAYLFHGRRDMLRDFFGGNVNPGYWFEKCVTSEHPPMVVSAETVQSLAAEEMAYWEQEGELDDGMRAAWDVVVSEADEWDGTAQFHTILEALSETGIEMADLAMSSYAEYTDRALRVLCAINWTRERYLAQRGAS